MDKQTRAAPELYERDFYSWTQEQARLLRAGQLDALDVVNIAEEIETLGRPERASLKSAYRLICVPLLKMKYQPERYARSWYNTIDRERSEIVDILAENPGLRPSRDDIFGQAYALARKDAARETRLALETFPDRPPFGRDECEDPAFLPQAQRDRPAGKTATGRTSGKGKGKAE